MFPATSFLQDKIISLYIQYIPFLLPSSCLGEISSLNSYFVPFVCSYAKDLFDYKEMKFVLPIRSFLSIIITLARERVSSPPNFNALYSSRFSIVSRETTRRVRLRRFFWTFPPASSDVSRKLRLTNDFRWRRVRRVFLALPQARNAVGSDHPAI